MDTLKPELIWINKRCYRFYESSIWKNIDTSKPYMEDEQSICSEEESEMDIKIIPHDTGFKHTFYVPKAFHSFIIGAKGMTIKKLEAETKTKINLPRNRKHGDIVITGQTRNAVLSARHRIDLITETSRKKVRYTHFLSIPLNKEEIMEKFSLFKNDVLEKYSHTAYNIDELLFQTSSKLHITIGMLTLLDDNEKKQAVDALLNCKEDVINPILKEIGPINIQLRGIDCMNDDPTKVKILFAKVVAHEKLQELVDKVDDYFVDIGMKEKEQANVKLHVTLMNTKYKIQKMQTKRKETFNASEILEIYKDTLFGEVVLNEIDISELHTATKDSYYNALEKISF